MGSCLCGLATLARSPWLVDVVDQHFEQVADLVLLGEGVAQWCFGMHLVDVAPTYPTPGQIAAVDKVTHDAVRGPLCDPHTFSDTAQRDIALSGHADQHVPVVGQERPIAQDLHVTTFRT